MMNVSTSSSVRLLTQRSVSSSIQPGQALDPHSLARVKEPEPLDKELETFMKDLDRLQQVHLHYSLRIQRERKESTRLDEDVVRAREELKTLREKTRNGDINRLDDINTKKVIGKLEHQLQMIKTKLSLTRNENTSLKTRIDELRREKIGLVKELTSVEKQYDECINQVQTLSKETSLLNEKKHRMKMSLASMKNKMIYDMEDFSYQLEAAENSITKTRDNIDDVLHDKMKSVVISMEDSKKFLKKIEKRGKFIVNPFESMTSQSHNADLELRQILHEAGGGLESLEDLVKAVQDAEENMFNIYNSILDKNKEIERLEGENKSLELKLTTQNEEMKKLQDQNDQVRETIDDDIIKCQQTIAVFDEEYNKCSATLASISGGLLKILKHLLTDEDTAELKQVFSSINERNLVDVLAVIEDNIDYLIQVSRAALHEPLNYQDFINVNISERVGTIRVPNLPSLHETLEDEDKDHDDTIKIHPVKTEALKEYVAKKLQAQAEKKAAMLAAVAEGRGPALGRLMDLHKDVSSSQFSFQSRASNLSRL